MRFKFNKWIHNSIQSALLSGGQAVRRFEFDDEILQPEKVLGAGIPRGFSNLAICGSAVADVGS